MWASLDLDGYGTLGLDFLVPTHKESFLEEPNPHEMEGHMPFRDETSLGTKVRPSTTPFRHRPILSEEQPIHASRAYPEPSLQSGK